MRQSRLGRAAAAALVAVGALGFSGPAGGAEGSANPYEITASGKAFDPKELFVKPDTEVTWTVVEADGTSHRIVLDDPKADCSDDDDCEKKNQSSYISNGVTFQRRFEEIGEYPYHCTVHVDYGMRGIVFVNETGTPPSTAPPPPPPTTAPPTTRPPTTSPPTTAPRPSTPPPPPPSAPAPPPAPTTTTKPPKAGAAGKVRTTKPPKPPKPESQETESTTTTVPPPALPPLAEKGPLVQAPVVDVTTTTLLPGEQSGEDGFVAINQGTRRGGVKKMTYAAVGALGLSLLAGGVMWWRRRPSRYWTA